MIIDENEIATEHRSHFQRMTLLNPRTRKTCERLCFKTSIRIAEECKRECVALLYRLQRTETLLNYNGHCVSMDDPDTVELFFGSDPQHQAAGIDLLNALFPFGR